MILAESFCATDWSGQKIHHVKTIQLPLIEHDWNCSVQLLEKNLAAIRVYDCT